MRLGIFSFQDFSQRLKTQHGYEVYILHFFHLAYSKYWGICQYKHVSHDYGAKEKYNASSATRLDLTLGVFARGSDIDVNCSADLGDMIAGELTTIYWIINGNFSEYYQKAKTGSGNDISTLYFTSLTTEPWAIIIPVILIVLCLLAVFACMYYRTVKNAAH
ncbi:uncharacterized protein [Aquarana catesbeiana]|uniref:uncharacterized protein isoform X3 n=1 Tax=Aquarana catesbeiana TaxID=8400 RepID=UPI003CC944F9